MNRFQKENCLMKIDGYFTKTPRKMHKASFVDAKLELIGHVEKELEHIKELTFEDFCTYYKRQHGADLK